MRNGHRSTDGPPIAMLSRTVTYAINPIMAIAWATPSRATARRNGHRPGSDHRSSSGGGFEFPFLHQGRGRTRRRSEGRPASYEAIIKTANGSLGFRMACSNQRRGCSFTPDTIIFRVSTICRISVGLLSCGGCGRAGGGFGRTARVTPPISSLRGIQNRIDTEKLPR